ncbi:unnamed protein product [Closterium sp. NIES-53]
MMAAFSCRGASPRLLVPLLLLSLGVLRIHARHDPEIAVADAQADSRSGGISAGGGSVADFHGGQFKLHSQSPEVGASRGRQHDGPSAATRAPNTESNDGAAESIAEWKRRSAEAGAHFFPLQRAEDAPSREEIHRRILTSMGQGMKPPESSGTVSQEKGYPLPLLNYDSALVSTANGTIGNTMVKYSTFLDDNKIRLPVYPYYVDLKLGSQKQEFSMALDIFLPHTFVPCDCLHCASMRKGTTYSKPLSTLSSTTLKYISCADQRCMTGAEYGFYGCNTEGLGDYLNTTGLLPGDDALCVYSASASFYDYYEADYDTGSYLQSVGHVVEDTVYLTAPDGTEVNRSIVFGCGVNQQGYWGMQGWEYGSWAAGGVLGLGWGSPSLNQLTGLNGPSAFAVCLEATPTNETGWDGQLPLQTGSSHLTIGATGLPAGANYSPMSSVVGMQYSQITISNATHTLNITDDPADVPADFPTDTTPGIYFMHESFVHLLRYPLLMDLLDKLADMTGQDLTFHGSDKDMYRLVCFKNKNKAVDPFTAFPTIDITFLSPDNTSATSHFYLKPREYLAQIVPLTYCVMATYLPANRNYYSLIGEPALFNKYLFLDYSNAIAGWMDAPHCKLLLTLPTPPACPAPSISPAHVPASCPFRPTGFSTLLANPVECVLACPSSATPPLLFRPILQSSVACFLIPFPSLASHPFLTLHSPLLSSPLLAYLPILSTGGAEPLLPPPSPPPPSPVSKGATRSLSQVAAALSAVVVLATSAALLALDLL